MSKAGKLVVFEGLDGCGKSTQLEYLRERLSTLCKEVGTRKVFTTREPSDSIPGLICRSVSKKIIHVQNETEALLFAADRYEHIVGEILPQLKAGNHVLCDRFYLSSFAYQSIEIDPNTILQYNLASMELIAPDVTIFIDVSPEECERRRASGRATEEKYENVERARIIRERYMESIDSLGKRNGEVLFINGARGPKEVFEDLWSNELSRRIFTKDDY